jgi:hypothetical protein
MLRSLLLLATLLMMSAPVFSAAPAGPLYRIAVEARDGSSQLLSTPEMVLQPGSLGKAIVDGADGYELELEIAEISSSKVQLSGSFDSHRGRLAPKVIVSLGEKVTLKAEDLSLVIMVERAGG